MYIYLTIHTYTYIHVESEVHTGETISIQGINLGKIDY